MKLNWGTGIVIVGLSFVSFIGVLAYNAVQQKFDLVSTDYYDQELKFQDQIERVANTSRSSVHPEIAVNNSDRTVDIKLPDDENIVSGNILFYKPDNAGKDKIFNLNHSKGKLQKIPASELSSGAWDAKITWKSGEKEYFYQQRIYIDK